MTAYGTMAAFGRRSGLVAAGALAAVALAACAPVEATTPGPETGASVADILEKQDFYEGEYLGQEVTVSAVVTDVITPESFVLAGAEYGDDSLLVQTPAPVEVQEGQEVRVTGTVGQFHRLAESDYAPGTYDRYESFETEAYIYNATVTPA